MLLKVILFQDGDREHALNCGVIPNVYPTIDFNIYADIDASFAIQRKYAKNGPLVIILSLII